jgi:hypothetical protein
MESLVYAAVVVDPEQGEVLHPPVLPAARGGAVARLQVCQAGDQLLLTRAAPPHDRRTYAAPPAPRPGSAVPPRPGTPPPGPRGCPRGGPPSRTAAAPRSPRLFRGTKLTFTVAQRRLKRPVD